jgi:hypothetical protein
MKQFIFTALGGALVIGFHIWETIREEKAFDDGMRRLLEMANTTEH